MENATKDAGPRVGSQPESCFLGARREGEGGAAGRTPPGSSVALSSSLSLEPGRKAKRQAFHERHPRGQGGASLPLVQGPLAPAPGPRAASAVTFRPAWQGHSTASRASPEPSTMDPRPGDAHPLPGGADPLEGWRQGPQSGLQLCLLPAGLVAAQPAGSTRRKVARLARPVCLSSNRTQEEAQGWLTPSCWPGGRHLQRWEACLLPISRRYGSRARAGSPLPPCSELTLPLPQQERGGGGLQHPPHSCPSPLGQEYHPPPGGGWPLVVLFSVGSSWPLSHPEGAHPGSKHSPSLPL